MSGSPKAGLPEKYLVDDLPGAAITGARLNGVLQRIDAGETLTVLTQWFLTSSGLVSLLALATGKIDQHTFRKQAARERSDRIQRAQQEAEEAAVEQARKTEAMNAAVKARFAAMANDPVPRRRREARELRGRFDIGYIEREHYPRAMRLLKQAASAERLAPEDVAWLSTEASDYWTEALQKTWHRLEAEAMTKAWEDAGDLWDAVNASAHWRKAEEPAKALQVTADQGRAQPEAQIGAVDDAWRSDAR